MSDSTMEQAAPLPGRAEVWPTLMDWLPDLFAWDVPPQLLADCKARHELGVQRYGRALETHNGRDARVDAYQEALDGLAYLWQLYLETEDKLRQAEVLELVRLQVMLANGIRRLGARR